MCGIAGYFGSQHDNCTQAIADGMVAALRHRGPDGNGQYFDKGVLLVHTRLSIIDLSSGGAQPMQSPDGRYTLVYNGELYNYRELRNQLIRLNRGFVSESDTEVVLQALCEWGRDALSKFNGMFALALWDNAKRELLLARDRFGQKPLYFLKSHNQFAFASEIKALKLLSGWSNRVSHQGLIEYLFYGNAQGSNTLYEMCHKLESGCCVTVRENEEPIIEPYWTLSDIRVHSPDEDDAITATRELLEQSIKRHVIADVPVGVFLSGGLDSSTVCHFATRHCSGPLSTWSVDFEGVESHSELDLARQVATANDTNHHEMHISYRNLLSALERMNSAHDQPFGDAANVPLFLMTEALSEDVKVVLQGDGGDELFGGYRRYQLLKNLHSWQLAKNLLKPAHTIKHFSPTMQRILRMADALGTADGSERSARLLTEESSPADVYSLLNRKHRTALDEFDGFARYRELWTHVEGLDPVQAMLWLDTRILLPDHFLEKVDRATMANSIEVRVPLLDLELADYVMGLPARFKSGRPSKPLLRSAMTGLLPDSVISGPKYGFGVPYSEWLRGPLADVLEDRILDSSGIIAELFDQNAISKLARDHREGRGRRGFMLYKLLMLAIWSDNHTQISI